MARRRIATARGTTKTPAEAALRLSNSMQKVFSGTDGEIVLTELLALTAFFRPPNYADWMKRTGTPQGFELHCALQAARSEPIRAILNHLNMSDEQMLALEKAAREARS